MLVSEQDEIVRIRNLRVATTTYDKWRIAAPQRYTIHYLTKTHVLRNLRPHPPLFLHVSKKDVLGSIITY